MFNVYKDLLVKHILIIRSSAKLFPIAVSEARKTFPAAKISCLTTEKVASDGVSLRDVAVDDVYTTPNNGFLWRNISETKKGISDKKIDVVIVLYNSRKGFGYLHIDMFARMIVSRKIVSVNIDKKVKEISSFDIAYKILHRMMDGVWFCVNYSFTIIMVVIISCGMISSVPLMWIMRLLKKL